MSPSFHAKACCPRVILNQPRVILNEVKDLAYAKGPGLHGNEILHFVQDDARAGSELVKKSGMQSYRAP